LAYTQTDRPLKITTPLGPDILLLTGIKGHEEISHLFDFQVTLIADLNNEVSFDAIVGQSVTMEMHQIDGSTRYFNGIVKRFSQSVRDENFMHFRAQVVPKLWLLSKKVRSRIFQHLTVPDILKQVLTGFDVSYDITGTYYQRDYCVQYRESDFDFASRLMEEEGIYYFFKHSDGNHQMMVSDNTSKHPAVPGKATAVYEEVVGDVRTDLRVYWWEKTQEVRASHYTCWDYCFEVPTNHLEATERTIVSVPVGKVTHKLNLANDTLFTYDYPGRYAQRYDGIDPSGGDRPTDITHMFEDRTRTVRLRMEQEEVNGILIEGKGDCGQFTAGHKFMLERHFDADASYLLTRIEHDASDESYRSDEMSISLFKYENRFTCIPEALRFRPQQVTPLPVIAGVQTATVVGPPGEEIFVDKYGRVKVQFHWDRKGKMDANSSCWVRVSQVWAGKGWGAFFWPRIGHEVVVIFEEGDPDQPLIVGSVYNHDNMPWYTLPKNKQLGGIKSASVSGTAHQNYNGIVFNDEKGKEHLSIHSEHNLSLNSEKSKMIHAGSNKGERVGLASVLTVGKFIPVTGGSGGGFDEGNAMPDPPPTSIIGLNSVVTYGDQFQAAGPVSHQITMGQNLQMCISTGALIAEALNVFSAPSGFPPVLAQILAGGMGAMQFTIGSSAQFTLGQSFEISVGPPKIELHKAHAVKFDPVRTLCVALGIIAEIFWYGYDAMKGSNDVSQYTNATTTAQQAAAQASEQSGDQERAVLILTYQALTDVMLVTIMLTEYLSDTVDWIACDAAKVAYVADHPLGLWKATPKDIPTLENPTWSGAGQILLGVAGVAITVITELATDKAQSQ
jgi:type VI secretion system secreted protein VgrG